MTAYAIGTALVALGLAGIAWEMWCARIEREVAPVAEAMACGPYRSLISGPPVWTMHWRPECHQCHAPIIADDDDAGLCVRCGGRNRRAV